MTTEPGAASITAARALLDSVREAKESYRAVDAAVTNHLSVGRERTAAGPTSTLRRAVDAYGLAVAGGVPGMVGGAIGEFLTGWAGSSTLLGEQIPISQPTIALSMLGSVVFGVTGWRESGRQNAAVAAADRSDEFLFAGVALELAMGDLRTALSDAGRGLPGATEVLATTVSATQEAFAHYIAELRQLDEKDVSIRFPWSSRRVDVALARELLALDVDSVLTQAGMIASGELGAEFRALPGASGRATSGEPSGGLDAVITTAEILRSELAESVGVLKEVEATLAMRARDHAGSAQLDAAVLHRIEFVVAHTHVYGGLVEADCLAIENVARIAATESVSKAVDYLTAAPSTTTLRTAFAAYAAGVTTTLQYLAPSTNSTAAVEAAASVRKLSTALPRLGGLADKVATALDAALPLIRHVAAS